MVKDISAILEEGAPRKRIRTHLRESALQNLMAKKPSKQEFRQTVIVCGIGMFVLGAIGFVILALMVNVFPPFFNWLIG